MKWLGFIAFLCVISYLLEKLTNVRIFKPIKNLPRLLTRLFMWGVDDAVGNTFAILLTEKISSMPSDIYFGANLIRPIVLIAINAYFIFEAIRDIREYKSWVSKNINFPH